MSLNRIIVVLVGTLFAALGIGFWVAAEQTAALLQMDAIVGPGLAAVRADLGGLFLGLAVLCIAGALARNRSFLFAGALTLVPIASGRLIDLIGGTRPSGQMTLLTVEVASAAALIVCARRLDAWEESTNRRVSRRWLAAGGILVVLGGAAAAILLNPRAELAIFERGARQATARDNSALLGNDSLRVAICGSSAPLPSPSRAKACVAVLAGGKFYLVDVGPESVENLVQWGIPLSRVGGVLLTHFHSDHIGDLGELNLQTWAGGRPAPLDVYGGPGVERIVNGFNDAYRIDQGYRTNHHTEKVMPPATWPMVAHPVELDGPGTPAKDRTGLVLEDGALRITAIEVDHAPIEPAYAYRFDFNGRSVVVTGDLKYHEPLAKAASGADILVSEAIARSMVRALHDGAAAVGRDRQAAILHDIQDYHISPVEAARIANSAGVKLLAFYHLLPAPDSWLARRLFAHDVSAVRPDNWTIADDGSLYSLPIDSDEVVIGRVNH
jgi:ribonuclease Z